MKATTVITKEGFNVSFFLRNGWKQDIPVICSRLLFLDSDVLMCFFYVSVSSIATCPKKTENYWNKW